MPENGPFCPNEQENRRQIHFSELPHNWYKAGKINRARKTVKLIAKIFFATFKNFPLQKLFICSKKELFDAENYFLRQKKIN